jgi:hypothetical protein
VGFGPSLTSISRIIEHLMANRSNRFNENVWDWDTTGTQI